MKLFKVMIDSRDRKKYGKLPEYVPWELVAPHEKQAMRNHDQTLERLNERGGLDMMELYAVVHGMSWVDVSRLDEKQCADWLIEQAPEELKEKT